MVRRAAFFLFVVALPAALSAQQDDVEMIRALRAQSNEALARHDVEGILATVDPQIHVTGGGGQLIPGADSLGASFGAQFNEFDDLVYVRSLESVEISASLPRAAENGTWVGTLTVPTGPVRAGGQYSAHWHKVDGRWLIRSEIYIELFCEGSGC
jgi:ketosteroid isomerase-like protein